jgi:hypothetical protein
MCYTPPVSFATAFIEFALAIYMRVRYGQARMVKFGSALLLLLGSYQISEFFLCTTTYSELWTKWGFVSYSFLPAVGLHYVLFQLRRKVTTTHLAFIYIVPVLALLASIAPDVIVTQSWCNEVFITAHIFPATDYGMLTFWIYSAYYAGFIMAASVLSINAFIAARKTQDRIQYVYFPLGITLMTVPTFLFLVVFPHFGFRFPSILCHFGLLLAACLFAGVRHDELKRKN